ncbi:putative mitochondrial protein, partial [Mucuna pruriens]
MGELKLFLGFQIKQENDGIYTHQTKYVKEFLKKFKLDDCKSMSIPMHLTSILTLDDSNKRVDQTTYRGIIGSLFLTTSRPDIMFSVCLCAHFQADPKYISTTSDCSQLPWIKHKLEDYNIYKSNIPLHCDNTTSINISKNPILHSRANHIEIKHHFI